MINKKTIFVLVVIFFVFMFLRFHNIEERIIFDWDQEQFSYQIKKIVEEKDFTLLGPRANNDRGFFLGPYFTYLLVPFYLFRNLHPTALIDFLVVYNIAFFAVSFFVISKLFTRNHAFIFLSLWAINSRLAVFDVIPWWPVLLPLGVLLTWYLLKKIYEKPIIKHFIYLGLILGLFSNMHFQFVFIILFSFIMLLMKYKDKNLFNIKNLFTLSSSFIATFIPLFIFDLKHNFLNSKLFTSFFLENNPAFIKDKNIWTVVFTNFIKPFIYFDKLEYMWLFIFIIVGATIYLIRQKKTFYKNFYIGSLILTVITPLVFYFYATRPSEYYFLYLIPFVLITAADFLFTIRKRYLAIVLIMFLLIINNLPLKKNLESNPIGFLYKDKTVSTLKESVDLSKKFNVTIDAPLGFNNGYKYLLGWYEIPQSGNFDDPLIEIKLPPEDVDIRINDAIGLIISEKVRK